MSWESFYLCCTNPLLDFARYSTKPSWSASPYLSIQSKAASMLGQIVLMNAMSSERSR